MFVDGVTAGNPDRQRRTGAMMAGPDGPRNRETMIRGMFSENTATTIQAKILKMMLGAPEATAVGALNATLEATTREEGALDVPVLAIYADHSRLASRDYLQAHYPHLEYTEISGTAHFLMLEKPIAFNRLLLNFLAREE